MTAPAADIGPHLPKTWEHLFGDCAHKDCHIPPEGHAAERVGLWYLSSLDFPPVLAAAALSAILRADACTSFLIIVKAALSNPEWGRALLQAFSTGPEEDVEFEASARALAEYLNVQYSEAQP